MKTFSITQHFHDEKRASTTDSARRWLRRARLALCRFPRRTARRYSTRELRRLLDDHVARDIGLDVMSSRYGDITRAPGVDAEWQRFP